MQFDSNNPDTDIDRPHCTYQTPACECRPEAKKCFFLLKIEEIMTFTSYQKYSVNEEEEISVRGTQGVIYSIGLDGKQRPLEQYKSRECAKNFDLAKYSNSHFVEKERAIEQQSCQWTDSRPNHHCS